MALLGGHLQVVGCKCSLKPVLQRTFTGDVICVSRNCINLQNSWTRGVYYNTLWNGQQNLEKKLCFRPFGTH